MRTLTRVAWLWFLLWRRERAEARFERAIRHAVTWKERALLADAQVGALTERITKEITKHG